jgi:hypothetical protein
MTKSVYAPSQERSQRTLAPVTARVACIASLLFMAACSSSSSSAGPTAPPSDDGGSADGSADGGTGVDATGPTGDAACTTCAAAPTCPAWTTFNFPQGLEGNVGDALTLVVDAMGDDPAELTYAWTASNPIGTFGPNVSSGASDTISFTCTAPGTTTLTLIIGPIPGDAASCSVPTNLLTEMVTCDPGDGGAVDSGRPDGASPNLDAGAHD